MALKHYISDGHSAQEDTALSKLLQGNRRHRTPCLLCILIISVCREG